MNQAEFCIVIEEWVGPPRRQRMSTAGDAFAGIFGAIIALFLLYKFMYIPYRKRQLQLDKEAENVLTEYFSDKKKA